MITACTKDCPDSCSIIIDKNNKIRGNPDHPVTQGFTCAKAKTYIKRLKSPDRITCPMLKTSGVFEKISWDRAMDICAGKINALIKDNPEKILHVQGHGARGVTKILVDNYFTRIGCTKTHGSLCDITGIQACIDDFGALDHNNIDDILNSSYIVNFGKDFSSSSIHMGTIIKKARKNGSHVTSIWPGSGNYGDYADHLIKINPGTDRFLCLAIIKCLSGKNQPDQSRIQKCSGRQEYFELLNRHSISFLSEQCGVSVKDIEFLAGIYSKQKVSTIIGWGVQRYSTGKESVRHINALAWLSGNVGYPGAGVYYNISSIRNLDLKWLQHDAQRSLLLPALADELERCTPGIKLAWINCSNIVNQAPDTRRLSDLFKNLDFTIVVDAFMNDTAASADLILPCTLMFEEDDVIGSCMHDYVQYCKKVFTPPKGCRSDLSIIRELNKKTGTDFYLPAREQCFQLSLPELKNSISYEKFKKKGFMDAGKKTIAFANGCARKSGLFNLVNTLSMEPEKNQLFPLRLLSLINRDYIHSQILPGDQGSLPVVMINPDSKHIGNINLKGEIYLVSPLGRLKVEVKFDEQLCSDVIIYRRGDWLLFQGGINSLIEAVLTDSGTGAAYYDQHVRLENQ